MPARWHELQLTLRTDRDTLADVMQQPERIPTLATSLRARLVEKLVWQMRARAERVQGDIDRVRKDFEFVGRYSPKPSGVRVSQREINGVPVEVLTPRVSNPGRVLMYLHGGGYVIGSPRTHRAFAMTLAKALAAEVWVPDYRLAPEHPFPAAQLDALAVWSAFVEAHPDAVRLLAGESAGGGLCVATCLRARDQQLPPPHGVYLISPWLDVSLTSDSCSANDRRDALLGHAFTDSLFATNYCVDSRRKDPEVSPLFADLKGLPPMLVQVGENEILLDDSTAFTLRAAEAGVVVDLERAPEMWHAWVLYAAVVPEARASLRSALRWMRSIRG